MIPESNSKSDSVVNSECERQVDCKKLSSANQADVHDDFNNSNLPATIVRDWRHKLQLAFLSNKTQLTPEAMPELDQMFTVVESYEMTIEQLQFSKIGKIMRHIGAIPDGRVPRDDEFRFRARANCLVEKWLQLLNVNRQSTATAGLLAAKSEERGSEEIIQTTRGLALIGKDDTSLASKMADLDNIVDGSLLADVTRNYYGSNGGANSDDNKKPSFSKEEEGDKREDDNWGNVVREWRHKLQRGFLHAKGFPQPEAMPELDQLFTTIENHNMTIEHLQFSKIGKVMRHIGVIPDEKISRDDEFGFRVRANLLVEKWRKLLDAPTSRRDCWTVLERRGGN